MTAAPVRTADEAPALEAMPDADPDSGSGSETGSGSGTGSGTGSGSADSERRSSGGFLARAALVTAVLSVAGSVLGLARDQALARLFGAGRETDAFLVAWTVPEFAATLLIEDGLAFALVPMFSLALARHARGASGDPVRALVASTLPRLALACTAAGALVVASAPWLVRALAPGLPDQALAVDCTRLTATCLVSFGLAGYCSAALRAHRRFLAPASIYVAYNTGIITAMFLLGGHWGVRSAAAGVAVGGVLMVAAQVPSLVRQLRGADGRGEVAGPGVDGVAVSAGRRTDSAAHVIPAGRGEGGPTEEGRGACGSPGTSEENRGACGSPGPTEENRGGTGTPARPPDRRGDATTHPPSAPRPHDPTDPARPFALALFGTVLLFALCRQSQVLIERFLASGLPSGAISHLNYAQKVAQIPMTLSLMLCTVTFPVVARALADGDTERARERVERDVALAACLVLLGAAVVVACAPQIVHLLFQRGAFTPADTAATAGVMRVYALGLLGQTVVGALARSYFSAGRASWYPLGAMAIGIAATAAIGAGAVGPWGVTGIAAANATGITVTAALLLAGMGPRSVPVRIRRVLGDLGRPVLAAAGATVTGALVADRLTLTGTAPGVALAAGVAGVVGVFVLLGLTLGVPGVRPALTAVTARLTPTSPRSPGSPRSPHPVTRRHPHDRFHVRFRRPR